MSSSNRKSVPKEKQEYMTSLKAVTNTKYNRKIKRGKRLTHFGQICQTNETTKNVPLLQPTSILKNLSKRLHQTYIPQDQSDHDKFFGDLMEKKNPQTIRIYAQNINGLQLHEGRGGKLADIVSEMKNMECDIFLAAEHNCNSWKSKTHEILKETLRENFDSSKQVFSSSQVPSNNHYKPGGTAIICQGSTVGRIVKVETDNEYGRWSVMTLQGKEKRKLHIVSAYQVCKANIHNIGSTTAYAQQFHLLQKLKQESNPCPRTHFIKDLDILLQSFQEDEILLCGDFNEEITARKSGITKIQQDYHLIDILNHRHSEQKGWNKLQTYRRGSKRIDYILCTPGVGAAIQSCGYEAYDHRLVSDHRGYYVDISIPMLFPNIQDQMAKYVLRGIKSENQDKLQKYIYAKNKYLEDHNMESRIEWLSKNLEAADGNYLEAIDNDLTRSSLHAEAEIKTKYRRAQWSVKLAKARRRANILKRILQHYKHCNNAEEKAQKLIQRFKISMEPPKTFQDCQKQLRLIQKQIKEIVRQSYSVRHHEMQSKAERLAEIDPNSDAAKILKRLIRAEKVHQVFEKLKLLRQGPRSSFLKRVKVPKDPSISPKECKEWVDITNTDEVEQHILNYNKVHFRQAEGTPWTKSPLNSLIQDFTGSTDGCTQLLRGNISQELQIQDDPITMKVLHQLKAKVELDQIDPLVADEAFEKKLMKWKESTSTSPSGVHLGHYKAMVRPSGLNPESETGQEFESIRANLLHYHLTLLNSCIQTTHVLTRWKPIASIALEKDPGEPKIHRLRIIHIYEADYNFMLANKWQEMIKAASRKGTLNSNQHAAPKKTAILPVVMEECQYEIARTSYHPLVRFDNDACACYDRILPGFGNLCSRRLGLHHKVASLNGRHLYQAQYRLKKGATTGEVSYYHKPPHDPVYGTGQGAGNSPAHWSSISSLLFDLHSLHGNGATFASPNKQILVRLHMTGYVDDSTISTNLDMTKARIWVEPDMTDLIQKTIQDGQLWHDLLWNAAGALALHKCSYHVLMATFDEDGIFHFNATSQNEDTSEIEPVQLQSYDGSNVTAIRRLNPKDAHRTLGCYKSPDGDQVTALEKLQQKCDNYASVLTSKSLDRMDAWIFYHAIFLPSVTYVLPSSHFTRSQLDKAQRKAYRLFFAQCGYNRNTRKQVLYGPSNRGGAGFIHMYDLQGSSQVETFMKLWRQPTSTEGRLLRIALHWVQRQAGTGRSIMEDTLMTIPYSTSKWFFSLRAYLTYTQTKLNLDDTGVTPIQRQHDVHLMDVALQSNRFIPKDLKRLNACRQYLNVCLLSDICNPLGTHIEWSYYHADQGDPTKAAISRTIPPNQYKPSSKAWLVWKKFVRSFCRSRGRLKQKLGPWLWLSQDLHMAWPAYYDGNDLFVLISQHPDPIKYNVYSTSANVASSTVVTRECDDVPINAVPAHLIPFHEGWTFLVSRTHTALTANPDSGLHPLFQSGQFNSQDWQYHVFKRVEIIDLARIEELLQSAEVTVSVATDGSHLQRDNLSSYGWVLANSNKDILLAGNGPVYAYSGSSYRAELVAIVAALATINVLTRDKRELSLRINLYTDSQSALDRLKDPDCSPLCPEWDALQQIEMEQRYLPGETDLLTYHYVKSHQDDRDNFENLDFPAQLNVLADQQAGLYRTVMDDTPIPFFRTAFLQLLSGNGLPITKHHRRTVRSIVPLQEYREAISVRWLWPRSVYNTIDWVNFSSTRPTSSTAHPIPFPTWVKLCNKTLPVGHKQNQYDPNLPHTCPSCGAPHEKYEHLFQCPDPARRQWRSSFQVELQKFTQETRPTDPYLAEMLVDCLAGQCYGDSLNTYIPPTEYSTLWHDQKAIGFLNMFCGHVAQGWAVAHHRHLQALEKVTSKNNGDTWVRSLIRLLHREWHKLWQMRNDAQHGVDQTQKRQLLRASLHKAIHHLQDIVSPKLPLHEQDALSRQVENAKSLPDKAIQSWIALWKTNFELQAQKYQEKSIEKTLSLTHYSQFSMNSKTASRNDDLSNQDKFPP